MVANIIMTHFRFILDSLRLLCWNYIKYYFNINSKLTCIRNVASQLSKKNVIYLKILQSLSTNGALFDTEQLEYLTQYTDNVPYTEKDINLDFIHDIKAVAKNKNMSLKLSENRMPFKAGMVALTYKATLDDKPVIIKVIRNNIREKIIKALDQMESLFNTLSWLPHIKAMNIIAILRENREALIEQTCFTTELSNLQKMKKNCEYTDYVRIPTSYPEFTKHNPNVIVMEFLEGNRIEQIDPKDAPSYSKLLAQFEVKTTLFNTFYHADLHSGNIVFMKNNNGEHMIGIFDFGIMGSTTKHEQDRLYNLLKAMDSPTENGSNITSLLLDKFIEPKETMCSLTVEQRNDIVNVLQPCIMDIVNGQMGITPYHLYEINGCLVKYKLRLANNFCKMHMAMLAMDSVSHRLNGRSSHLKEIRQMANEIFTDSDSVLDF